MRRVACISLLILATGPAAAYIDQFVPGDLPYDVASAVEARGCVATQDDWASLFSEKGGHISDFQANVLNMYKNNELSSTDGGKTLRLHKFGKCQ